MSLCILVFLFLLSDPFQTRFHVRRVTHLCQEIDLFTGANDVPVVKYLPLHSSFSLVCYTRKLLRTGISSSFIYVPCIRSILVYASLVFFYALPKYLRCELERVQKGALLIICPSLSYDEALKEASIPTIISYREDICDKVFNAALGNKDNKLNKLLNEANKAPYSLRHQRHFALLKWKTDDFKNNFVLSSCLKYN